MTLEEFEKELEGVTEDALKEGTPAFTRYLSLSDLVVAFLALRQHREEGSGLFDEGQEPSDEALLAIFAFLALP